MTFNRTSMELKHFSVIQPLTAEFSFNRTSMELKRIEMIEHSYVNVAFNRTSMELKPHPVSLHCHSSDLLIEPVWN